MHTCGLVLDWLHVTFVQRAFLPSCGWDRNKINVLVLVWLLLFTVTKHYGLMSIFPKYIIGCMDFDLTL